MHSILKNDIDAQRTKKYGFADHCVVLKAKTVEGTDICLVLSVELRYFKNGRANMHTIRTYMVYVDDVRVWSSSRKADATKLYNSFK